MTRLQRIAGLCQGLIVAVFLANAAAPDVARARTLDSIRSRGSLLVCANPNALPFSSKTGDRRGFELELGEALANQLGVRLEVGWAVFPAHVNRIDCDVMFDA